MSLQAGLSFEQAPPFSLPLRFFLSAPLFLLAAAMLIMLAPEALAARWSPQALALTHALTLGVLSMTMLGALMQMLPVVAGTTLPAPRLVAGLTHVTLTLGTLALMAGFLTALPLAFTIGMALLGTGFAVFLAAATRGLVRAVASVTVTGMRFALTGLGITVVLGVMLALMRSGVWVPPAVAATAELHVAVGLLGWVGLLVIGVAYQVVPMFQITPPYPPRLSRWLTGAMFTSLLLHAAATVWLPPARYVIDTALAGSLLVFALATLRLQFRRRRKLPDVSLDFWRLGMASLIVCVAVWLCAQMWPAWAASHAYPVLLGVLFIGGFAVSVVNGMLYKIVPFLAWFHLQAQLQARAGSIPTMRTMLAERPVRWQFRLHLAACILLVASLAWAPLVVFAGGALALSAGLLWLNLYRVTRLFLTHGGHLS